jgi:hypothetical protein
MPNQFQKYTGDILWVAMYYSAVTNLLNGILDLDCSMETSFGTDKKRTHGQRPRDPIGTRIMKHMYMQS